MSTIAEVEEKAMSLSKVERGELASRLIASLGSPFEDDEDVIELALQRDREMDEHPETVMSEEEFWASIDEYRRK
jgi:hypothetical protein